MRVLFADAVGGPTVTELEARGHTCVVEPALQAGDLAGRVAGFDALVVRSTKVTRDVFETADRLALVIRAGAGTNTIDTEAAAARGVLVANLPGRNAAAVAELTMGLLLAIDRRIVDSAVDLRAGRWDKSAYSAAPVDCSGRRWASSGSARSGSRWPSAPGPSASTSGPWRGPAAARPRSRHAPWSCASAWPSRSRSCCRPATSCPSTSRRPRTPSGWSTRRSSG